ncbi:MAG: thioredoxin [Thermoproteota archaeon]
MVEDEELEKIKRRKLRQMMEGKSGEEENSAQGESATDKPVELTDSNLKKTIQGNSLVVVDCWAPWCAPCRMVAPILEEMAKDYAGKILFGKLNVDENRKTAVRYQIRGIPALLVFKNGEHVDTIVGAMPRRKLEPKITRYL